MTVSNEPASEHPLVTPYDRQLQDVHQLLHSVLRSPDESDISHFRTVGEAQLVLDEIWKVRRR